LEQRSLILRSVRYLESDRVVTFFSREEGVLTGFARGAAGMSNRFGASLEALTLSLIVGRSHLEGTLYRIHKSAILNPFSNIKSDLDRSYWAGMAVRFLMGLLPPALPEPLVFDNAVHYLESLSGAGASPALSWIRFATCSLDLLGYQIRADACSVCRVIPGRKTLCYYPMDGRVLCTACLGNSGEAEDGLRVTAEILRFLEKVGRRPETVEVDFSTVRQSVEFLDRILSCRVRGWKTVDALPISIV
jgi:DNA repair protein RecO (recombination protein O)